MKPHDLHGCESKELLGAAALTATKSLRLFAGAVIGVMSKSGLPMTLKGNCRA
jgi:hypothetical protein